MLTGHAADPDRNRHLNVDKAAVLCQLCFQEFAVSNGARQVTPAALMQCCHQHIENLSIQETAIF